MTAINDSRTLAGLPVSFPADMDPLLDEPRNGELVPLTPQHVAVGDHVLIAGESAGDRWFGVAEVGHRWLRPVGLARVEGDQVWVLRADAAGGAR